MKQGKRKLTILLCVMMIATVFAVAVPVNVSAEVGDVNLINLTSNQATDLSPTMSPDGSKIAFISNRDGSYGLWMMDSDGTNPQKIVAFSYQQSPAHCPKWSPDGSKIAYWDNNLYTISPDGSNKIMIKASYTIAGHGIAWNSDSTKMAYIRQPYEGNWDYNNELYIDDFVGDVLPSPDNRLTFDGEDDGTPEWTADDQSIIWGSGRDSTYPHSPAGGSHYDIYKMNLNTGNVIRLTFTKGGQFPKFSPDGTKILWTNYNHTTHTQSLWLMNSDGSNQKLLLDNDARNTYPSWFPDGNRIIYASNVEGNWDIWIMELDDGGEISLPFFDNFEDGDHNNWNDASDMNGDIRIESGNLDGTGSYYLYLDSPPEPDNQARAIVENGNNPDWNNYVFELDSKIDYSSGSYGYINIFFYLQSTTNINNGYYLHMRAYQNSVTLFKRENGINTELSTVPKIIDIGITYHVKVIVSNGNIKQYIDSIKVIDTSDSTFTYGTIGFSTHGAGLETVRSAFDNIIVKTYSPVIDGDPTDKIEEIIEDIIDMDLSEGIENSLKSKLRNATDSWNKGHDNAAMNQLEAFINQIEALRKAKKLTEEEANALIEAAQWIIDTYGDLDNDGLPNYWEKLFGLEWQPPEGDDGQNGADGDPDEDGLDNDIEYQLYVDPSIPDDEKPNPQVKDIYVEVDWMSAGDGCSGHEPEDNDNDGIWDFAELVIEAFANAPIGNPNAKDGIKLHIDDGSMGGGNSFTHIDPLSAFALAGPNNDFYDIKQNNFDINRRGIFHYCIFGHTYLENTSSTGFTPVSTLPGDTDPTADGDDFFVADQHLTNITEQAGTFMHELGHNLGLVPTGFLPTPFEGIDTFYNENYRSCMNYNHQLTLVDYSDGSQPEHDFNDWNQIDLTRVSTSWDVYEG